MNLKLLTGLLASLALPAHSASLPIAVNSSSILWDFGPDTWVENIVQRPCGSLLVTTLSPNASVFQLTPRTPFSIQQTNNTTSPKLIYTFPHPAYNALGLALISKTPESYAIATSGFNGTGIVPDSNQIWTLTFDSQHDNAAAKLVATLPDAQLFNGLTSLPWSPATVLVADSIAGTLTRVDTRSGAHAVVLSGEALNASVPGVTTVNGLKARSGAHRLGNGTEVPGKCAVGSVYFTNAARTTLGAVLVGHDGTPVRGCGNPISTVQLGGTFADDLAFAPRTGHGKAGGGGGDVFVATEKDRSILRVTAEGKVETVFTFPGTEGQGGPTAVVFDQMDENIMYVASADGNVYALDVRGLI